MSSDATRYVWQHSSLVGLQFSVHHAVADIVNVENGYEFWASTATLAEKARVSRSTAVSALAAMVDHGYLRVLERGGKRRTPTRYLFMFSTGTSAPHALDAATSAPGDITSAIDGLPLARQARTNLNLELEVTKEQLARLTRMPEANGQENARTILRSLRNEIPRAAGGGAS